MKNGRLTLDEFKNELLVQCAILSGGDLALTLVTSDVATHVPGKYYQSWVEPTEEDLRSDRYLTPGDYVGRIRLSLAGLRRAEAICVSRGEDIWELMDDAQSIVSGDQGQAVNDLPLDEHVASREDMVDLFHDLEHHIKETLRSVRSNNQLMNDPDAERRVTELESGATLLKGNKIDVKLLRRTILPALTWLSTKGLEEGVKQTVKLIFDHLPKLWF